MFIYVLVQFDFETRIMVLFRVSYFHLNHYSAHVNMLKHEYYSEPDTIYGVANCFFFFFFFFLFLFLSDSIENSCRIFSDVTFQI